MYFHIKLIKCTGPAYINILKELLEKKLPLLKHSNKNPYVIQHVLHFGFVQDYYISSWGEDTRVYALQCSETAGLTKSLGIFCGT